MKTLRLFIVFVVLFCFAVPYSIAGSEAVNLEKTPLPHIYAFHVRDYSKSKDKIDLPLYGVSDEQIDTEAGKAGWSAFNMYFGLEGAVATVMQECMGATFLNNINSACSEIGGALVVMQLMMDLASKDYAAANINFGKGSIYYAMGKWGSRAVKLGAVAAVAVEMYLTIFADTVNRKHDEFYYETLRWYFTKGLGHKSPEAWKQIFTTANIQTPEDIMKIVDAHVEEFWISDNMYNSISAAKKAWGIVGADPGRFQHKKKHFKEYAMATYVLPYTNPVLNGIAEEATEKKAQKTADELNVILDELNREYTLEGSVRGPKDKIENLRVRIPGFLEAYTDAKGRFKFRFTLYALLKSHLAFLGTNNIEIELRVPSKDGFEYIYKRDKIKESHKKTGRIKVTFKLKEGSFAGTIWTGEMKLGDYLQKIHVHFEVNPRDGAIGKLFQPTKGVVWVEEKSGKVELTHNIDKFDYDPKTRKVVFVTTLESLRDPRHGKRKIEGVFSWIFSGVLTDDDHIEGKWGTSMKSLSGGDFRMRRYKRGGSGLEKNDPLTEK